MTDKCDGGINSDSPEETAERGRQSLRVSWPEITILNCNEDGLDPEWNCNAVAGLETDIRGQSTPAAEQNFCVRASIGVPENM